MMYRVRAHKIALNEKNHFEKNHCGSGVRLKWSNWIPQVMTSFFPLLVQIVRLLEVIEFARTWNNLGSVRN